MSKVILLTLGATLGLASAQPAAAAATIIDGKAVVGSDAAGGTLVDNCGICAFVINQAFGIAGLSVTSYEFRALAERGITPFLATRTNNGSVASFTITGVGATQTASLGRPDGYNTFAFDTISGSNLTTADTYFGFAYNSGNNNIPGGVVAYDNGIAPGTEGTFVASEGFIPALNASFTASFAPPLRQDSFDALVTRTYSINASAESIAAVPEPTTWALMILGFGIVGSALRRRRRTQVRFNFA